MMLTKVIEKGNRQALIIPSDMRTEKKELIINKIGDIYVAYPKDDPWASTRYAVGTFSEDFMIERNQPS